MKPNHVQVISKEHKFNFAKEEVWSVNLNDGYQATAQLKSGGGAVSGTWSTIYD